MSDRRSYVALDWVNAQIAETLQQAEEALSGFIANPHDITKLRFGLTHLHQVTGSLVMVELQAASMLSREMENLLNAALANEYLLQPQIEAAKLINPLLLPLTQYLDKVATTHEDNPREILELLNIVRTANHLEPFSEADIFNPDIAIARQTEKQQPAIAVEEFNELIRKLRQSFQTGLIGIVRDKDLENNFQLVSKVCHSLLKTSVNTASEPLWQIAFAIADQLAHAGKPADIESKKALKQIDTQIKHLEEAGRDALSESPDSALLKALLYSVATTETVTLAIAELRAIYNLDQALAESEAAPAEEPPASKKLVLSIIDSLRQELALIAGFDLGEMNDALVRLQNTLRIVAVNDLLASSQAIEQDINSVVDDGSNISSRAESICAQLDIIEQFLQSWQDKKQLIDSADVARRYQEYLANLRQDLDMVKQTLASYAAENCNKDLIQSLPELLDRLLELLAISPLKRLIPIIQSAYQFVVTQLLWQETPPHPLALQALADAISSIDYYLERLPADSSENLQTIINVAVDSIDKLQKPIVELIEEDRILLSDEEVYDDNSGIAPAEQDDEDLLVSVTLTEDEIIPVANIDELPPEIDEAASVDQEEPQLIDADAAGIGSDEISLQAGDDAFTVTEVLSAESTADEDADDLLIFEPGEDADEEILEIFIEEAREVVEHIREYLPQLDADHDNLEALLEIRRSYHTLKGSGRMVGALHIGDFAWSVERMLNNVRDGLGKVNANTLAILHLATDFVPALIDGMEQRSGISKARHRYIIDRADAEFEGRPYIEAISPVTAVPVAESLGNTIAENESDEIVDQDTDSVDEELLAIFLAEAQTYLDVLGDYLDNIDPGYEDVKISSELQRALHTLKGSSHMAGVNCVATLVSPLEAFVKDLNNFQTTVDAEILAMLVRARELLENQLALLEKGDISLLDGIESYVAELKLIHAAKIEKHEIEARSEEGFADKYTALMSEALDCLSNAADLVQEWQSEGIDETQRLDLVNCLYRLGRTAAEARYQEVADLATALADYYQKAIQDGQTFNLKFFTLANKAHDELDDMMNVIAAHQLVDAATDLVVELQQGAAPLLAEEVVAEQQKQSPQPATVADDSQLAKLREQALAADPDTLEIFTEEAEELLDILDALMHDWFSNHKDRSGLGEIKRIIHTIKGGARLTDINVLADITQAYEQCIDRAEAGDRYDDAFFAAAQQFQNQTAFYIGYIVSGAFREELAGSDNSQSGAEENRVIETLAVSDSSTPESEPILAETAALDNAIASEFDEAFAFVLDSVADTEDYSSLPESLEEIPQALVEDEEALAASPEHHDTGTDFIIDDVINTADMISAVFGEETEATQPEAVESATLMGLLETTPEFTAEEPALLSASNDYTTLVEQYRKADPDTLEIFLEEALELDAELDETASAWFADQASVAYAAALKRILHTLKGGARLAELSVLGDLTHNCESMIEHAEARRAFDAAFFADLQVYVDQIHQMIEFVANGARSEDIPAVVAPPMATATEPEEDTGNEVVAEIVAPVAMTAEPAAEAEETSGQTQQDNILLALAEQYHKADQDTLEIFLEEAIELDADLETAVAAWLADRETAGHADALKRILHTLKGGARLAELAALGDLTHDFESMIEHAEARRAFDDAFFVHMQQYHDQIHRLVEFISNGAKPRDMAMAASVLEPVLAIAGEASEPVMLSARLVTDTAPLISAADDIDDELLALFVEEAKEQSEGIEECIANFLKDPGDIAPLDELKRLLHTLKGGARLTGVRAIGDMSHDFETFIINSEREKKVNAGAFVDEMQAFHDRLTKMIAGINVTASPRVEDSHKAESNVVPIRPGINVANTSAALVSQAAIDATRAFIENFNKDQQRSNREPVKITPDLLEDLINLAGEGSISRSRIEEQMNEIIISQVEMDATVDRLHNQLRRLEIETEAQIVFRQEQVVSEGQENFDPLEMDRYTHMQQLSKSLIESASDLDDISATFTNKMRDMETLLLQQARINTELQEGLMRCQMVPFSRMVPRLRRIVRQVAQELGKKVEFEVENAEGELDRTILERMVAPLEHMLRNAVDHGIEMPDVRKAAGKPQQGTIVLALSREGGEIVLTLRDDGAGVNIAAVRKKAIERGLMTEDATLSDHELSQFILHAGFSTAQKVTQISGRGVGMDVVHSEIKQMGGSLDINSKQGQGSVFTVRLPFTVSVNRALMVVVGTDTYAIPLNTIEGIVRVSPYELEAYYQPDAPMFEYAGQSYHLRYMGSLLHRGHRAKLEGLTTPLPVVLIRSSDYTVAVQVDKLLGSREVVVKSLGPQFSMVGGLSGATVLGDGSVVIILDMLSLIRADFALGLSQSAGRAEEYAPEPVRKITTVMVVDDSVTVRKVTSRLLERFGMNVILAKDGLDALTQLQEMDTLPDVMLLDIEMPRMDGFEVVSRVRHDIRLQHIPITMITSRTGEKHRERAIALGATRYLGKPFQERELLQTISELTGADIQQA